MKTIRTSFWILLLQFFCLPPIKSQICKPYMYARAGGHDEILILNNTAQFSEIIPLNGETVCVGTNSNLLPTNSNAILVKHNHFTLD